jgi:hypothetical protein
LREEGMTKFLEIKCLSTKEQDELERRVEESIARKKKEGTLTERELREIEEKKLLPLLDIQDVQSVYENFLFREKDTKGRQRP